MTKKLASDTVVHSAEYHKNESEKANVQVELGNASREDQTKALKQQSDIQPATKLEKNRTVALDSPGRSVKNDYNQYVAVPGT